MIIGFSGAKGVGKSSLASELQSRIEKTEIMSFAEPLKKMLEVIGVSQEIMADPKLKNEALPWLGVTPRFMLQTLGTEWGRDMVHNQIWLKVMNRKLASSKAGLVLIDDCRFQNEADLIRSRAGVVIELYRKGIQYDRGHTSEKGIDNPDYRIDVDDVKEAADRILKLGLV
jgi:hypothetical protein